MGSVEKYMKHPGMAFGRRIDLFGFADLLGCRRGQIALFQVCAGGGGAHAGRRAKILGQQDTSQMNDKEKAEAKRVARYARGWMQSGGQIMIISWAKKGTRGKKKKWTPRVEHIR